MNTKELYKYLQYLALCDLKTKDYKVILYLLKKLQKGGYLKINQNELADELAISKSDVSKALYRLEQLELLYFDRISDRKKMIRLELYSEEELDDKITDKINDITFFNLYG